jgi:hypothetical protein
MCPAPGTKKCGVCRSVSYCSVDCQKTHWTDCHKFACTGPYIVRATSMPNKGLGVFARNDIQEPYTRVLTESCVGVRNFEDPSQNWVRESSEHHLETLCYDPAFDGMQCAVMEEYDRFVQMKDLDIFHRNAFRVTPNASLLLLFLKGARFNHSCVPNCYAYVDVKSRRLYICTMVSVKAGEELTISYLQSDMYTREQRRAKLLRDWKFTCKCDLCHESERSDRNRAHDAFSVAAFASDFPALLAASLALKVPPTHHMIAYTLAKVGAEHDGEYAIKLSAWYSHIDPNYEQKILEHCNKT